MDQKAFGTYEIAQICHVTPSTVGNWIDKGLLPTFTTGGGHRRVWQEDLMVFLKKHNIPATPELSENGRKTILIVDDEAGIRRVVRRTLQKMYPRAQIHEAEDGFDAGKKVARLKPALVILDLKLPGVDGFKVCRDIRADEQLKGTKVLAISGHNAEEWRNQSLSAGADDFLGKPFLTEDLEQKVLALFGENK